MLPAAVRFSLCLAGGGCQGISGMASSNWPFPLQATSVCGHITLRRASNFLKDFLHKDSDDVNVGDRSSSQVRGPDSFETLHPTRQHKGAPWRPVGRVMWGWHWGQGRADLATALKGLIGEDVLEMMGRKQPTCSVIRVAPASVEVTLWQK